MRLSDDIAGFMLELLNNSAEKTVEMQRTALAEKFNCVPSQINYVLSTRFTPEHGYIVQSRRGGGGYIRIMRVSVRLENPLMHLINMIGDSLDAQSAAAILQNLHDSGLLSTSQVKLINAALSPQVIRIVTPEIRDALRAEILKQTLISLQ